MLLELIWNLKALWNLKSKPLQKASKQLRHALGASLTLDKYLVLVHIFGSWSRRRVCLTRRLVCAEGRGVRLRAQVQQVSDQRDAQHAQSHRARHDRLVRCAHAHHVAAERSQSAALGGRLERGPSTQRIHTLLILIRVI